MGRKDPAVPQQRQVRKRPEYRTGDSEIPLSRCDWNGMILFLLKKHKELFRRIERYTKRDKVLPASGDDAVTLIGFSASEIKAHRSI